MKGGLSINIWIVMGLGFGAIGLIILLQQFILHRICTGRAEGLIVAGVPFQAGEAARMLTFTANGEKYRLPFSGGNKFTAGDTVTVVYYPSYINRFSYYITEDRSNLRILGIVFTVAGIISILGGAGGNYGWFTERRHF